MYLFLFERVTGKVRAARREGLKDPSTQILATTGAYVRQSKSQELHSALPTGWEGPNHFGPDGV